MTSEPSKRTLLVNFRASPIPLSRFDQVCALSGKTRTDVLIELMQEHVAQASASISETRSEKRRKIDLKPFSRSIDREASKRPLETSNLLETLQIRRSKTFWDRMMSKMHGDQK